jgi:putative serine protease PepD
VDAEDQGVSGPDPGEEWGEEDNERLRGWISPDDRLWRHPSEAAGLAPRPAPPTLGAKPGNRVRTGTILVGGATTCLVLALIATGLIMVVSGTNEADNPGGPSTLATFTGTPTTEPGVAPTAGRRTIAALLSDVRDSTVAVGVVTRTGTTVSTGLVVESGGMIVTTTPALAGARSITVIEPNGTRQPASMVGEDPATSIAVVRISDDLPAASFDDDDPPAGSMSTAMAMTADPRTHGAPVPVVYAGTVVAAGRSTATAGSAAFATTMIEAPLGHDDIGCPLLDSSGAVSGILEGTRQVGSTTLSVFLPAELVYGVAQQLIMWGEVEHGWLGIKTGDSAAPAGAVLDAVDTGSPVAGVMAPGDVITAIDGDPVHSNAELLTRLYAEAPGTAVTIDFQRQGTTMSTSVVLADEGTDAQAGPTSP